MFLSFFSAFFQEEGRCCEKSAEEHDPHVRSGIRLHACRSRNERSVVDRQDLQAAVAKMLATEGPYILECAILEEDNVLPMTPPGMNVDQMMLEI